MMSFSNSIVLSDEQFLASAKLTKPFSIHDHDIRYKGHVDEYWAMLMKGKGLDLKRN